MCQTVSSEGIYGSGQRTVAVAEAVGLVLAHDITEIRQNEFKGRAFKRGQVVKQEDIGHLLRLGKENLFVLNLRDDEMHEDTAAEAMARALMGEGVELKGGPKEGKINIIAKRDGLLRINKEALFQFNLLGEVMCATLHDGTLVKKGQVVAGTRAIPLVISRNVIERAVETAKNAGWTIGVKEIRKPKAGIVITGSEIYYQRIKDAFAPVIIEKVKSYGGEIVGLHYAPDDRNTIARKLETLIERGADLLITTGGMSVDPDDVTRFAIKSLGAVDFNYGAAVLPGSMFLIAYLDPSKGNGNSTVSTKIPVLGIPACGMYATTTVFDLVLPRILAGEPVGRRELAEMGHGGLCLKCKECRYPVCPFGKG